MERGATPRVEARSLEPPVGETRGPSVWDPDGDPRGAYAFPACPQCVTEIETETQACSAKCPCDCHVAAHEAEAAATRSTPATAPLEAAT